MKGESVARRSAQGEGSLAVVAFLLVALLLGAAGFFGYLVFFSPGQGSGGSSSTSSAAAADQASSELKPKAFSDYTWDELSQISAKIAAAGSDEEGRAVAQEFGILDASGNIVDQSRDVVLSTNFLAKARVVGVRADMRSDTGSVAGLTFMVTPISKQAMNATETNVGGWEASALRVWLSGDGLALLPEDLSQVIAAADKKTNNVGLTDEAASVTTTQDKLWCFSVAEVFGDVDWYVQEFSETNWYLDPPAYDALLAQEGAQYQWFSQIGASAAQTAVDGLVMTYGGPALCWWLRTPYAYDFLGNDPAVFFQVMQNGYPSTVARANSELGVAVGFCL